MDFMSTDTDQQAFAIAALRLWSKRQKALADKRDPLVLAALKAGVSSETIHMSTGLARTTIDRIKREAGDDE